MRKPVILWIDDEIDRLESLVIFLKKKGYDLITASSGRSGIDLITGERREIDLVLLDQFMPVMDGIETLRIMRREDPDIPVIMVTKSEDELTMDEAFGMGVTDYLIKPVKPKQVLSVLKKHIEGGHLREISVTDSFATVYTELADKVSNATDWTDWANFAREISRTLIEMDSLGAGGEAMKSSIKELRSSSEKDFCRFIEREYVKRISRNGVEGDPQHPPLSHELLDRLIFPQLREGRKTALVVMDCMRLDQWMVMERSLKRKFDIASKECFSLLPTATPFSRNAIFSGMLPSEMDRIYPGVILDKDKPNRLELEILKKNLMRNGLDPGILMFHYIFSESGCRGIIDRLKDFSGKRFVAIVYSFMDILTHTRSENRVLREMIPDAAAFRNLADTWFEYSQLKLLMEKLGELGYTVVATSDHGSIQCNTPAKVTADRSTTTHLRFKRGTNIRTNKAYAVDIREPLKWGLPSPGIMTNYLVAKEDYFLIYANEFTAHRKIHSGSFLHGGISIEEMIIPCAVMKPR